MSMPLGTPSKAPAGKPASAPPGGARRPAGVGIGLLVAAALAASVVVLRPVSPPAGPTATIGVEEVASTAAAYARIRPQAFGEPTQPGTVYVVLMTFPTGLLEFYDPRPFVVTNAEWLGNPMTQPPLYYRGVEPVGTSATKGQQLFRIPARSGVLIYRETAPPGPPTTLRF